MKDFFKLREDWDSQFNSANSSRKERLQKLLDRLDYEFPTKGKKQVIQRAEIDALLWALLGGAIMLYSLGMNGPALVELQGILERMCIREIPLYLCHNNSKQDIIKELIERKSLLDLALIVNKLGIWNTDDLKYTKELNTFRNGVAHRNPKPFKVNLFLNIDSALVDVDIISYIIKSSHLLNKLFIHH